MQDSVNPPPHLKPPPGFTFHARFEDVDEMVEGYRWFRPESIRIERGPFTGYYLHASLETVLLSHARFGRSLIHRGSPPPGVCVFGVPGSFERPGISRGRPLTQADLIVLRPGRELDNMFAAGFEIFPLKISEQALHRAAEVLKRPLPRYAHDDADLLQPDPVALNRLR